MPILLFLDVRDLFVCRKQILKMKIQYTIRLVARCLIDNFYNTRNDVWITSQQSRRNNLLNTNLADVPSSLPLTLFLLIFFLLSSFPPHSTIRIPGTGLAHSHFCELLFTVMCTTREGILEKVSKSKASPCGLDFINLFR